MSILFHECKKNGSFYALLASCIITRNATITSFHYMCDMRVLLSPNNTG